MFPALSQVDVCLAWPAFPKLKAGIAIPTADIDKRALIIKDSHNLVSLPLDPFLWAVPLFLFSSYAKRP